MDLSSEAYYSDKKKKWFDLSIGFLAAAFFWYLTFHPLWYVGPIAICLVSLIALKKKVTRKYVPIGALGLLTLPFFIWWTSILFVIGVQDK